MAGIVVGAFTITKMLVILFFGIPHSLKLNKLGKLNYIIPLRIQLESLIISLSIFVFIYWLVYNYFHRFILEFNIGVVMAVLKSLNQVGANQNNISDFNEAFSSYMKNDSPAKVLSEVKSDTKLIQPISIPSPPILSEQNMRPGYILFISSNQFSLGLKMVSTKMSPDEYFSKNTNPTDYYRIKNEIQIKTGNIELMSHDLDGILASYRYSKESYSYTISKTELKDLLLTKKIPLECFD